MIAFEKSRVVRPSRVLGLLAAGTALGNFISPAAANTQSGRINKNAYYALGDSVAAGLGLRQSPKATPEDKLCGRSSEAYSAIVAANLKLALSNVACSGAVVANLSATQKVDGSNIPAQLNEAFAKGPPKLITITIGANDVNWSGFLTQCFTGACNTAANTKVAGADLTKLSHGLEKDLQSIKKRSSVDQDPAVTTVVTGYYNPMSNRCGLPAGNVAWLSEEADKLNATLEGVTQHFSFARFAPVENYFAGHGICTPDPWVQPLLGAAPLHPTDQGQQAIAESVLNALHGSGV
jgi:lysophospholipase L1-like esterase